ncbi:MAG: 2-C-methyl-D-erythritol 2,4-cyclodiphosphate synthase [Tepidamorphaceae bacterium]
MVAKPVGVSFLGLKKLNEINSLSDFVLIQDAARPFLAEDLLSRIMATVEKYGSALPVVPLADTLKQLSHDGIVEATPDRGRLFAAQTPQAFAFKDILEAHRKAAQDPSLSFTDDASIAEWAGMSVHTVEGDPRNFKITTPDDFARAETYIAKGKKMETRIGQGFDVHRFAAGDHVILGGVKIPHDMALSGHSDADVLLHAITDALYGSIADGDIGAHFPPSDPKWKGADSTVFLDDAVTRVRNRGGEIVFLDATILCETPKIGPHRDTIRTRIAEITGLPTGRIAVKATTTEQLGFTGRREGIAAMALATIRLPSEN